MSEPKPLASLSSSLLARKGTAKPAMRRQGINFPEAVSDNPESIQEDLGWNDMGYDVNPDHSDAGPEVGHAPAHHNPLAGAIPHVVSAVKQQQLEIAAKLSAVSEPISVPEVVSTPEPILTPEQVLTPEPILTTEPISSPEPVSVQESVLAKKPAKQMALTPPAPLSISREVQPLEEHSAVVKAAREHKRAPKKPRAAAKSRTRKAKAAFTLRLDADRHLKLRLATTMKNVSAQQLVTKAVDDYLKTIPELEELASRIPARGGA